MSGEINMRILFAGIVALAPSLIASEVLAQACPQGVVEVPRGRGATISIERTGADNSQVMIEWIRDGSGYYTKDVAQEIQTEQGKKLDYKITNAAAFNPRPNSELSVRVTTTLKAGNDAKCMGEAFVRRLGDKAEVEFRPTKGGAANTVVTVNYVR